MEQKIQLKHPAGKKAVSMDKQKYDVIKKVLLSRLKTLGKASHSEILRSAKEDLKKNKTKFQGSVEWHLEWVKLDLEARKKIKRLDDKTPVRFTIA